MASSQEDLAERVLHGIKVIALILSRSGSARDVLEPGSNRRIFATLHIEPISDKPDNSANGDQNTGDILAPT